MRNKQFSILVVVIFVNSILPFSTSCAQSRNQIFTKQDTLRGTITPERAWWDVLKYEIYVKPDYSTKSISGENKISFKVVSTGKKMQLDLQEPMEIKSIDWKGQSLSFQRTGNVYFTSFPEALQTGRTETIRVQFAGTPVEAKRAPWDGGWIWAKDDLKRPWMSVACQGLGASVWYPCKDHQSDEPDQGAMISINVPDSVVAVSNGRPEGKQTNSDHTITQTWKVINPINSYNIVPYIGNYVTWHEEYQGEKGKLDLDFYVIDNNLEKAKSQFKQVHKMLKALEYWFGPYPFYEDGYKLIESPHLGMEHQSGIAYGNKFQNGYSGRDLSGTGWGSKWDFIIVHESGHEWFGNNITSKDLADMWIHESFTNYSETLFTEFEFGKEAATDYVVGIRKQIKNTSPIVGKYGVNNPGSGDMYYKGGNMLHTIRQVIGDDEKFRQILRGLNKDYYHQTVTGKQVEDYFTNKSGKNLSKIFDQYLRNTSIPKLEYYFQSVTGDKSKRELFFRWVDCIKGFKMPVKLNWTTNTPPIIQAVEGQWKSITVSVEDGKELPDISNRNYYIRWENTQKN